MNKKLFKITKIAFIAMLIPMLVVGVATTIFGIKGVLATKDFIEHVEESMNGNNELEFPTETSFEEAKDLFESQPVPLDTVELTKEDMDAFLQYMDSDVVTEISEELGSATAEEYIRTYVEEMPEFEEIMLTEFNLLLD